MKKGKKQVQFSCSLFIRFFLVKDARMLNKKIGTHFGDILEMQVKGELPKINQSNVASYFIEPMNAKNTERKINFDIKQSLYDEILTKYEDKSPPHLIVQNIAEMAINNYILGGLSDNSERGKMLIQFAIETLQDIEEMNHALQQTRLQ